MIDFNLSKSLMSTYEDYKKGNECGLKFLYINLLKKFKSDTSPAFKLGQYFEYLCLGTIPRYEKKAPEPERTLKGELKAPYQRVYEQAAYFKKYIKSMDIKITATSIYIKTDDKESGELDFKAIMPWEEGEVIVDMKYSGLLDDKWSPFGWDLDSLPYKPKIMLQPVHYQYLELEETGKVKPFYFMVFSSGADMNCKFIKVNIDPQSLEDHKNLCDNIRKEIELDIKFGFKAIPELVRCRECPMFETCEHKTVHPIIDQVNFSYNEA